MRITEFITESSKICPQCGMKGCPCKPGKCNCKPKPGYPKNIDEAANPAQQAAIAIAKKKKQGVAEGVRDLGYDAQSLIMKLRRDVEEKRLQPTRQAVLAAASELAGDMDFAPELLVQQVLGRGVAEGENWSKHNNKRVGGMSKKSVSSYRRSHPGSKIQTAVTTKPSKIKKGSKDSKRRASFCARMRGMKKHNTSAKTANDPDSNINKSLRRWHCESIEQLEQLVMLAEQKIRNLKK
jgi:transcription termination factor NusB